MKLNKYTVMMVAAGFLSATSCTDFDDYNETYVDANPSADKTLWENITSNPELTSFVDLVKKAGFDKELQGNRYYTVWAPVNDALVNSPYFDADSAVVLERFVKNHVADYNNGAVGAIDGRIHTLNRKSIEFKGSESSYFYSDVPVKKANVPGINGLLHTLDGVAQYYPNVYDYISLGGNGIDSVTAYFKHYEDSILDRENSIIGPIIDGKQTYIDSVMIKQNSLTELFDANLSNEDSSYTVILPNNDAWIEAYNRIKPYYKYITTLKMQDLDNASGSTIPTIGPDVTDATLLQQHSDSLVKMSMMSNFIYSNNSEYNKWLENGTPSATDTLYTTSRRKLSNPADLLARTVETEPMSNGNVIIVDSIAALPWETYVPQINVDPRRDMGRVLTGTAHNASLAVGDWMEETGFGKFDTEQVQFIWVEPSSGMAKPELDIYLPNVLSTTYDFYCVFLPASVVNSSEVGKPNYVQFTLNYCNDKGNLTDYKFESMEEDRPEDAKTNKNAFANDISKADTIYMGRFKFPVAYRGLSRSDNAREQVRPNIKITSPFSQFNQNLMKKYTRDICIAAIILKPVELTEFENKETEE